MGKHVIVDLEFCNVTKLQKNKQYKLGTEIIQIGAVLLDEEDNEIDSFCTYVAPEYGRLDNFIRDLTGIKDFNLKDAPKLYEALNMFMAWVPKDAVAVSWSHTDDKHLAKEVKVKGLEIEGLAELLETWEDCQMTFSEKMGSKDAYNLTEALNIADISYDDGAHDGLVDARNTARLYAKMQREEEFTLNRYYMEAAGLVEKEDDDFGLDWTKILAGIKLPES